MPTASAINVRLRAIRARAVMLPMTYVLGTSAQAVRRAPMLLVDLETHEGITGHAFQFCYTPVAAPAVARFLEDIAAALEGELIAPVELWAKLAKRYTLIGVQGIVRMAMSLVDTACWDVLAKTARLPLARYIGAAPRPIPAYNSNGLGLMSTDALADEAEKLLAGGFRAVKLRLGYATLEEDLGAVRAVKKCVGDGVAVMVDYNQALGVNEAIRRGRALDGEDVYWIEEPVRHDDYVGCARIAREVKTPVQVGENFSLVYDMRKALDAHACDCVMPDLERIGGVTGWLRAAALAQADGIPMSSHLYPEVSVHLLAATATAHWLEYVDWMNRVLKEPLEIRDGMAVPPERPGIGIEWDERAVEKLCK